ncbi:MAG: hypothetical protein IPJ25_15485 [Rhodocyclaceae bacterium]|nr:hypothetical protein [Rhodocyclaceae bacterium]
MVDAAAAHTAVARLMSSLSADTACGQHQLANESLGSKICRKLDHQFDTVFGTAANPSRHLGALGFLFLWIVVVSGIYVYIMFDTSVAGAYESIESLSRNQPLSVAYCAACIATHPTPF